MASNNLDNINHNESRFGGYLDPDPRPVTPDLPAYADHPRPSTPGERVTSYAMQATQDATARLFLAMQDPHLDPGPRSNTLHHPTYVYNPRSSIPGERVVSPRTQAAERERNLDNATLSQAGSPLDQHLMAYMHAIERGEVATTTQAESSTIQDANVTSIGQPEITNVDDGGSYLNHSERALNEERRVCSEQRQRRVFSVQTSSFTDANHTQGPASSSTDANHIQGPASSSTDANRIQGPARFLNHLNHNIPSHPASSINETVEAQSNSAHNQAIADNQGQNDVRQVNFHGIYGRIIQVEHERVVTAVTMRSEDSASTSSSPASSSSLRFSLRRRAAASDLAGEAGHQRTSFDDEDERGEAEHASRAREASPEANGELPPVGPAFMAAYQDLRRVVPGVVALGGDPVETAAVVAALNGGIADIATAFRRLPVRREARCTVEEHQDIPGRLNRMRWAFRALEWEQQRLRRVAEQQGERTGFWAEQAYSWRARAEEAEERSGRQTALVVALQGRLAERREEAERLLAQVAEMERVTFGFD